MKIAIDLNDVVRDFSNNFVKYYVERYNHEYNLDDFELYTNELDIIFPFKSKLAYQKFLYEDYSYELYSKCPTCGRGIEQMLNEWTEKTLKDIDTDEPIEVMFVSPMEYGGSIGCTYMFLAKIGTKIRECYMPTDSTTIWDKCDVLITANPGLLGCKPEGKVSIKITTDYNKDLEADYTYNSLTKFLSDENNTLKLINKTNDIC